MSLSVVYLIFFNINYLYIYINIHINTNNRLKLGISQYSMQCGINRVEKHCRNTQL